MWIRRLGVRDPRPPQLPLPDPRQWAHAHDTATTPGPPAGRRHELGPRRDLVRRLGRRPGQPLPPGARGPGRDGSARPAAGRDRARDRGRPGRARAARREDRGGVHRRRFEPTAHRERAATPRPVRHVRRRRRPAAARDRGAAAGELRRRRLPAEHPGHGPARAGARVGVVGGRRARARRHRHDPSGVPATAPCRLGLRRGPQARLPPDRRLPHADGRPDEGARRPAGDALVPPAALGVRERPRGRGFYIDAMLEIPDTLDERRPAGGRAGGRAAAEIPLFLALRGSR